MTQRSTHRLRLAFLGWGQGARCLFDSWATDPSAPWVVAVVKDGDDSSLPERAGFPEILEHPSALARYLPLDLVLDFRPHGETIPEGLPGDLPWIPRPMTHLLERECLKGEDGRRYRGVVETARDAVVTIDESHRIVFFNKAAEQMFGYSREEVLGEDLSIIIPTPHKRAHRDYVRRYVETRRGRFIDHTVDLTAERRSGEEFPVSISFSVAEVGEHLLMTAMIRDMTEIKALERRLIENERLASIGRALSFVTHEVKNPLVVIGGFARALLRQPQMPEDHREKLEIIHGEVQRLEALLKEIQDFSKPIRLRKEPIVLPTFLEGVLSMFRDSDACSHISFSLRVEGRPTANADPDRLRQVLINLIKNATEAISGEGQVVLGTRESAEGRVQITVEDTGEGMPPEKVEELFQPFVTTKAGGTGLGLPMCRKIIREHGGELTLIPKPGGGTTALIALPSGLAPQEESL